jgi:hypothetical protein
MKWILSSGALWNSRSSPITSSNPMNNKTRTLIRDIQNKIRNPITKEKEFANEEAVIDYAIKTIYDLMKKQRLL